MACSFYYFPSDLMHRRSRSWLKNKLHGTHGVILSYALHATQHTIHNPQSVVRNGLILFASRQQNIKPEAGLAIRAEVDVNVFELGVLFQSPRAQLAPDAALLVAAKRRFGADEMKVVDPYRARADAIGDFDRA